MRNSHILSSTLASLAIGSSTFPVLEQSRLERSKGRGSRFTTKRYKRLIASSQVGRWGKQYVLKGVRP